MLSSHLFMKNYVDIHKDYKLYLNTFGIWFEMNRKDCLLSYDKSFVQKKYCEFYKAIVFKIDLVAYSRNLCY